MEISPQEKTRLTQYLLGELPAAERDQLEAEVFTDPAQFDQLCELENSWLDGYARGTLTAHDRERFERGYPTSPEKRERIAFARAFVRQVDEAPEPVAKAETGSWWREWLPTFTRPVLATAAVSVLFAAGVWQLYQARENRRRAEIARKSTPTPTPTLTLSVAPTPASTPLPSPTPTAAPTNNAAPVVASLTLTAVSLRDTLPGETPILRIPRAATAAELSIKLTDQNYATYQAVLKTAAGNPVLTRRNVRSAGRVVVLRLPPAKFPSGDYRLVLEGLPRTGPAEPVATFTFKVERR